MRYIPLLTAGVFLSVGNLAFAAPATLAADPVAVPQPPPLEPAPTAQANPATQPAADVSPIPAAQPATAEGGSILVLPFTTLTASTNPWLSRAIQQDLVVDLVRTTRARIQAPGNTAPAADAESAIQAGKQAGASHVIFGQLQASGGQMRTTGQLLDVATGKPVGGFNATAPANDLFPLEDSVAGQVLRALPAGWVTVPLPPLPGSTAQPSTSPPPPATSTQEYYSYTYPDYASGPGLTYSSTYWGYPYYWYAVPYYGPDFLFYGGWDHFHNHFWGHGWDHGYYGHYYGGYHPFDMRGYGHAPSYGGGGFHGGGGGFHGGGGGGGGHR